MNKPASKSFNISEFLPRGTAKLIYKELKGKVTIRTIQRILAANRRTKQKLKNRRKLSAS